jgi:hypothetical protein
MIHHVLWTNTFPEVSKGNTHKMGLTDKIIVKFFELPAKGHIPRRVSEDFCAGKTRTFFALYI